MNLNLELTDHCNLKCRMCSQSLREEAHGVPMRFMDFKTWRAALQGLKGLNNVDLCPHWLGEPTLHPQFELFLEYAFAANTQNQLFRSFKIHTNAVIFPESRARCLLRLAARTDQAPNTFKAIHFSIDAYLPSTYQQIKGADHRSRVFQNIERFLALRGNQPRPVVHLAFVVQDGNTGEVLPFIEHWKSRLQRYQLCGDWPSLDSDAIYLRRWNTGDQAHADRLHQLACLQAKIPALPRAAGSF